MKGQFHVHLATFHAGLAASSGSGVARSERIQRGLASSYASPPAAAPYSLCSHSSAMAQLRTRPQSPRVYTAPDIVWMLYVVCLCIRRSGDELTANRSGAAHCSGGSRDQRDHIQPPAPPGGYTQTGRNLGQSVFLNINVDRVFIM